jgi:hypothetical protein
MKHLNFLPLLVLAASLFPAALVGGKAWAADPPDETIDLPPGIACSNFALRVELWEGKGRTRELKDKNGYTRSLFAGTGSAFRLTNLLNGKSISTNNNGSSGLVETYEADGTVVITMRGHALIIWFPTDNPPGPWTSLLSGHLVYSQSPDGVGSLLSMNGNATDVCTELT